jgi:hypothetical protein
MNLASEIAGVIGTERYRDSSLFARGDEKIMRTRSATTYETFWPLKLLKAVISE